MSIFENPFKSSNGNNVKSSDDGWQCPKCGVIVNLAGDTRCICGYDKNSQSSNLNPSSIPTSKTKVDNGPYPVGNKVKKNSEDNSLSLGKMYENYRTNKILQRLGEEQLYEIIYDELDHGEKRSGLWMKAIAQCGGDNNRVVSIYVQLRLQSLKDELEIIEQFSQ